MPSPTPHFTTRDHQRQPERLRALRIGVIDFVCRWWPLILRIGLTMLKYWLVSD